MIFFDLESDGVIDSSAFTFVYFYQKSFRMLQRFVQKLPNKTTITCPKNLWYNVKI